MCKEASMPRLTPSPFDVAVVPGLPDKGEPIVYNEIDDLILPPSGTPSKDDLQTVDALTGTDGRDKITVHTGNDVVHAQGGDDLMIDLMGGNDQFFGEGGNDRFVLGRGNDFVDGGVGSDTLDYSGIAFKVVGDLAQGFLFADGVDEAQNIENIIGSNLDDTLIGDAGRNVLRGMGGNDEIRGTLGSRDALYGDDGDDTITGKGSMSGGNGNDTISSFAPDIPGRLPSRPGDTQHGDAGNDTMTGGLFNDQMFGGTGNDVMNGGRGQDLIHGGDGVNTLAGGSGGDTFVFQQFGGNHVYDWITDFEVDNDKIDLRQIDADPTTAGMQDFVFTNRANRYDDDFESSVGGPALNGGIGRVSSKVGDGYTYIYVQTEDGWQAADIVLTGEHTLTEENFVL
jgi:Ca2+-binding RTX toxin-like protein